MAGEWTAMQLIFPPLFCASVTKTTGLNLILFVILITENQIHLQRKKYFQKKDLFYSEETADLYNQSGSISMVEYN